MSTANPGIRPTNIIEVAKKLYVVGQGTLMASKLMFEGEFHGGWPENTSHPCT
jgi:hypothetical protein